MTSKYSDWLDDKHKIELLTELERSNSQTSDVNEIICTTCGHEQDISNKICENCSSERIILKKVAHILFGKKWKSRLKRFYQKK